MSDKELEEMIGDATNVAAFVLTRRFEQVPQTIKELIRESRYVIFGGRLYKRNKMTKLWYQAALLR